MKITINGKEYECQEIKIKTEAGEIVVNNELVAFMNFAHDAGYMSFETINSIGKWKMNYETYNMEKVEK